MLVLSRKKNEAIVIGDDISIVVIEIVAGKVRLGVAAPSNVTVNRKEVHDAIERNKAVQAISLPIDRVGGETNG